MRANKWQGQDAQYTWSPGSTLGIDTIILSSLRCGCVFSVNSWAPPSPVTDLGKLTWCQFPNPLISRTLSLQIVGGRKGVASCMHTWEKGRAGLEGCLRLAWYLTWMSSLTTGGKWNIGSFKVMISQRILVEPRQRTMCYKGLGWREFWESRRRDHDSSSLNLLERFSRSTYDTEGPPTFRWILHQHGDQVQTWSPQAGGCEGDQSRKWGYRDWYQRKGLHARGITRLSEFQQLQDGCELGSGWGNYIAQRLGCYRVGILDLMMYKGKDNWYEDLFTS
jgi:hypothetical protein